MSNFFDAMFDERGVYRGLLEEVPVNRACRFDPCRTIFKSSGGYDSCPRCRAVEANAQRTAGNVESDVRRDCETLIGRLQRELIQRIALREKSA